MAAFIYVDDIAGCIVYGNTRKGSHEYKKLIEYLLRSDWWLKDWPVVREGREHDRQHRQMSRLLETGQIRSFRQGHGTIGHDGESG
ncbi:MAG: hypothetical protein GEU76_03920 [Alphaproteobacteria bacterium]|nr:hypothetical protein [Alphaproteobacteria bacterium]